ncbi:MAG: restriction endonuclease subunit S [Elusimicrobiota bacterium]
MINYSIIQKSQLESAKRLDAEYYQPEYLANDKIIKNYKNSFKFLGNVLKRKNAITGGATPLGADYPKEGISFLRVQNVMQNYLDLSDVVYISEKIHNGLLKRSQIKSGDVLLTITGVSYGKSATIPKDFKEGNINQHSVKIEVDETVILPEFLSTFLNTKFGKYQNDRKITGLSRPGLVYTELKNILVPLVSMEKQKEIKKLVENSYDILKQSETLYSQAEELLLEELGLKDYKIEDELSCVVDFSEAKDVHRIDAEYFQPKYEKLISKIKKQNAKMLGDLVSLKKGIEPGADEYQNEGKLFIRVSNLSKQGLIDKDQKYLSDALYNELRKNYEPKQNEILLTKDATPGIAYVLKELVEGIVAGGVVRLKVKEDVEPEYIALCINSLVGQMQIERDAGGSIIIHLKPEQIKNLQIPILPKSVQQKITDLVHKSHDAHKKAKELLSEAKQKVEKMILGEVIE